MRTLPARHLVLGTPGAGRARRLPPPPDRIGVWGAIRLPGGESFSEKFCGCGPGRRRECIHAGDRFVRALWTKLERALREALKRTSLEDLRRDERSMMVCLVSAIPPAALPDLGTDS